MPDTKPSAPAAPADPPGADPQLDWAKLYGERYYLTDYTVPYGRNEHWLRFFGGIADRIVHDLAPRTALDAGCAMGLLVEQLVLRGVDASGVDISEFAIAEAPEIVRDKVRVASLTDALPNRYDLITCIEVLEHLPKSESRTALANLCMATDRILFSSVPDGYEEPTHVNVQPAEEWSAWFADEGFVRVLEYDASYLAPWAILYERRRGQLPDVVRDYDRVLARLKVEVEQLRASILQMHAEREAEGSGGGSARPEEREIESLHEQLLNARDIIAGLEVEVGEALGQNTHHLSLLEGKDAAAREYERVVASKAYRATLKALSPYRRVRRFLGR